MDLLTILILSVEQNERSFVHVSINKYSPTAGTNLKPWLLLHSSTCDLGVYMYRFNGSPSLHPPGPTQAHGAEHLTAASYLQSTVRVRSSPRTLRSSGLAGCLAPLSPCGLRSRSSWVATLLILGAAMEELSTSIG